MQSLGQYWNNNPSERPDVTDEIAAVVGGLVAAGANVDYRGTPNVEIRSKSNQFLRHIDSILGDLSRGVEEFRGNTLRLRTRPHPKFGELGVSSSNALRYYYAYAGSVRTSPTVRVQLPSDAPDIPQKYDMVSTVKSTGDVEKVIELDEDESVKFFKYIGNPVPGYGEKWPALPQQLPDFDSDSTEIKVDGNTTGVIKWENRDGEYVFLWYQKPFRVATENGAYSMGHSLREKIPDHIETVWVADRRNSELHRFKTTQFYDAKEIPAGEYVVDEIQYAVDVSNSLESHTLPTELH